MRLYKQRITNGSNAYIDGYLEDYGMPATLDDIKAALAEFGLVAVPVEPSEAMIEGYWGEITHGEPEREAAKEAYKAMIAAAQGGE